MGDGRTFTFLIQRYLEFLAGNKNEFRLKEINKKNIVLTSWLKYPHSFLLGFTSRFRLASARGVRLRSLDVKNLEKPNLYFRSFLIKKTIEGRDYSKQYYGAMLHAMAKMAKNKGLLRVRIPIDIRTELKEIRAFGNFCPCLSIEIKVQTLLKMEIHDIADYVYNKLKFQYQIKAHHSSHLEALIYDRYFEKLQTNLHDYDQDKRANTMVITYMGNMKSILSHAPFKIRSIAAHTPTWGGIGLKLDNQLIFNLNSFQGIWSPEYFNEFFSYI